MTGGESRAEPATVLVLSDREHACELLCRLLERAGHRTERVTNTHQALTALSILRPECILLDLAAGGIGRNLEVLDAIRAEPDPAVAATRVVLIAQQSANRMFSWKAGTDGFLVRPFHADELVDTVADVLARSDSERVSHRDREVDAAAGDERR